MSTVSEIYNQHDSHYLNKQKVDDDCFQTDAHSYENSQETENIHSAKDCNESMLHKQFLYLSKSSLAEAR